MIGGWGIFCKIALRWMSMDLTDKSTLVQVMAWCRQATSHYLIQCWPSSMSSYGITRPQWVKLNIEVHAKTGNVTKMETWIMITDTCDHIWQCYLFFLNHIVCTVYIVETRIKLKLKYYRGSHFKWRYHLAWKCICGGGCWCNRISIIEIWQTYDCLISTMGFLTLVRLHLFIKMSPCICLQYNSWLVINPFSSLFKE